MTDFRASEIHRRVYGGDSYEHELSIRTRERGQYESFVNFPTSNGNNNTEHVKGYVVLYTFNLSPQQPYEGNGLTDVGATISFVARPT